MSGYYRMARGWMDNPALGGAREPYCRRAAWAWLIEEAVWTETRIDVHGKTLVLRRGQLCRAQRDLAAAWKWSLGAVQRFLDRLETESMIETRTESGRSVITLCNYDKFQAAPRSTESPSDTASESELSQERVRSESQKKEDNKGNEDKGGDGTRAHAHEAPAPVPASTSDPIAIADAVAVIRVFDETRATAYGESRKRAWPSGTDRTYADRWLKEGADTGIPVADVVQLCRDVFTDVFNRMQRDQREPPDHLAFFDQPVRRALKLRVAPLPEVSVNHGQQRYSAPRRTYGSDGETGKLAILDALAPELGLDRNAAAAG